MEVDGEATASCEIDVAHATDAFLMESLEHQGSNVAQQILIRISAGTTEGEHWTAQYYTAI